MSPRKLKMISVSNLHKVNLVLICKSLKTNLIIDELCSLIEAKETFFAIFLEESSLGWMVDGIFFEGDKHHIVKGGESGSILGVIWMNFLVVKF